MSITRLRQGPTCSRRHLAAASGAGLGSLALGGLGFATAPILATAAVLATAAQIDATPPAAPVPQLSGDPSESPEAVAARLGYDASAIFRFVADEIHFESYAGTLRGARGTLRARAGNAADQAALLGAMFAASQIPYRFATAPLPQPAADGLAGLLKLTADNIRTRAQDAASAAVLHAEGLDELPDAPPELSADEQELLEQQDAAADRILADARTMAQEAGTTITNALADAGIVLPPLAAPVLTAWESAQHVWIQVADGPHWIDYDPTVPDAEPGSAISDPAATYAAAPDEWRHHLTVRIVAEENYGGFPSRRDMVTLATTSDLTVDTPIGISLAPAEGLGALGSGITQFFTSQQTIYPSIMFGNELVESSSPMVFATSGASAVGVLDDVTEIEGAGEGETVAAWLAVDIASPDTAPVTVERALLDRVPAEDRAAGLFVPTNISPIAVRPNILGEESIDAFDALTMLQVECATMPGYQMLSKLRGGRLFGPLEAFGAGMGAIRHALGLEHELDEGSWSYPTAPNVTAITFLARDEDDMVRVTTDLLYRQRAPILLDGAETPGTHPAVRSGVLDATAEAMLLAPASSAADDPTAGMRTPPSVGRVFQQAARDGISIVTLVTVDDLARVTLDAASAAAITAALTAGSVVVVPEQPVELDGDALTGWWIIDPLTGQTRDMLSNGKAFASVAIPAPNVPVYAQDTLAWYARWAQYVAENIEFFACLGMTLGLIALIVETKILYQAGPGGQAASAITGTVVVFGAGGLTLC